VTWVTFRPLYSRGNNTVPSEREDGWLSQPVWNFLAENKVFHIPGFEHHIFQSVTCSVGTAIAQWLRCFATNRKDAGSIPAGGSGIFH